ncbi:MAG: hypothetical protein ABI572_02110 [Actinomycetota bacterium]
MRRFRHPATEAGSSPMETLLLGALVFVLAAAIVGFALMMTLAPRSVPVPAPGPMPSAQVIEIDCGTDVAVVTGGAVDAGPRGAPVLVIGDEGATLVFTSPGSPDYRMRVFEPTGRYLLPLAPGVWEVGCAVPGSGPTTVFLGTFEVRDPAQIYLRSLPDGPPEGACAHVLDVPPSFAADQLGALHEGLAGVGVLPTDTIERAAYAASRLRAEPPTPLIFRVVRDGRIVARVEVAIHGDAWTASVFGCPEE